MYGQRYRKPHRTYQNLSSTEPHALLTPSSPLQRCFALSLALSNSFRPKHHPGIGPRVLIAMSVVGFDLGNDTAVIAAVKQRGIDVLLNDESNRETPSAVSFGEKQRFLGSNASSSSNPKSTVSNLKLLIGRSFSSLVHDLSTLPFSSSAAADGSVAVHTNFLNSPRSFTPAQILAMLLSHLKQIAEKNLEAPVSDCVIGVPCYFTDLQRRLYLDAAAIAGLKPLRLMHDTTAIALGYGIYKTDITSPINVVFIDIGHCDTQVAVVAFSSGGMKVLSHGFDANLGGRDFDEVLFRYFAEDFRERYGIDVRSNVRAGVRLRAACEKLKKVLSANAEAPINIECLMEEKDVKGFIKRDDFERLSAGLLERVLVPVKKALDGARLGLEKVHSVELVGSGSRVPAIMRILSGFFGREPGRTLNASECVARGCALQAAMLCPVFRVREFEVQDSFPFSIGFSSDEGPISTMTSNILFKKGQPFPSVKILTFHRAYTFQLEAFYVDEGELPPGTPAKISRFTIGPFQVPPSENRRVKVKLRLNLHGIVYVESASLIEDEIDDPVSRDESHADMDSEPESASTRSNNENSELGNRSRISRSARRNEIPVSENVYGGMTKAELLHAQEQEQQLANQDRLMEQTKDKKNSLEAYVYDVRNKLFERYRSFASESEREGISTSLQQTEEWLYEDGDDETESVYTSKLEDIKKIVDPIEKRCKDEEARVQATRDLLKCIVDQRLAVKSLATYERDAVINECNKAEQWLREKSQQQDSLPKNTDPILWSHDIKKKTEALNITCRNILRNKGPQSRTEDNSHNSDNMRTD